MKSAETQSDVRPEADPAARGASIAPAPVPASTSVGRGLPLWVVLAAAALILRVGLGGSSDVTAGDAPIQGPQSGPTAFVSDPNQPGRYLSENSGTPWGGPTTDLLDHSTLDRADRVPSGDRRALAVVEAREASAGDGPTALHGRAFHPWVVVGESEDDGVSMRRESERAGGQSSPWDASRTVTDGPWELHDEAGRLVERGAFLEGKRHGLWTTYGVGGAEVESIHYVHGLREGDWRAFAPTGEMIGEGHFEANLRQGEWVLHYSSGHVRERGSYLNGLREGLWEFYDDLGRPTARTGTYLAGAKVN